MDRTVILGLYNGWCQQRLFLLPPYSSSTMKWSIVRRLLEPDFKRLHCATPVYAPRFSPMQLLAAGISPLFKNVTRHRLGRT